MNNFTLLFLSTIIFLACNTNDRADTSVAVQEATPEVLKEKTGNVDLYSKRLYKDLIDKLFREAKEKDPQLHALTERIDNFNEQKENSLKAFETYSRNNQQYWNTVDQYLEKLNDSTLRNKMKEIFSESVKNYQQRIQTHQELAAQVEQRKQMLADQQIIMKLLVTAPMMGNYQKNELPESGMLESVREGYEVLIREVKNFSEPKNNSEQVAAYSQTAASH